MVKKAQFEAMDNIYLVDKERA